MFFYNQNPKNNSLYCNDSNTKDNNFNEKYFRPSSFPSLNIRDLSNIISTYYDEDYSKIKLPNNLVSSPKNTIINFYSILREASNIPKVSNAGEAIGYEKDPYPIAYKFLSKTYRIKLPYDEFLSKFFNIGHINLIKLVKDDTTNNNILKYVVELESIDTASNFNYSYAWIEIVNENGRYKINNIELYPENFLYPAYHGCSHKAEYYLDKWYGKKGINLIRAMYPAMFNGYIKDICILGKDGYNYLFKFIHLTNGTDVKIGEYKQINDSWIPLEPKVKPTKLEDAMEKIESNTELAEAFVDNPIKILEGLGVDTMKLISKFIIKKGITEEFTDEEYQLESLQGCASACLLVGASVGGDAKDWKDLLPDPPKEPKKKDEPKITPPTSIDNVPKHR